MNGQHTSDIPPSDRVFAPPAKTQAAAPESRLRWALHGSLLLTALAMATAGGLQAVVGAVLSITVALGVVEPAVRFWRRQHARLAAEATQLERLALVAERTNNLVIITDAARRIAWVNEAFIRVSGYTLAEVAGRKPAELQIGRAHV